MRLNTQNGKTEEAYPEKLRPEDRFYIDDLFFYILHMDDGFSVGGSTLDVIDRATGKPVQNGVVPDGCPVIYVTVYRNITYFCVSGIEQNRGVCDFCCSSVLCALPL